MSDRPPEDNENENNIDELRRRLLQASVAGAIGYPMLIDPARAERTDTRSVSDGANASAVSRAKEGIVIEQNGTTLRSVEPITDAQSVVNYYGYDESPGDSAATPDDLATENATVTFLYRNTETDDLSLVIIHGDAETQSGGPKGRAVLKFDGVSGAEWQVQDGPDGDRGFGDIDDYSGKSVGETLADGDTVGWGWDDNRTDGGAIGPLGESLDVEITHLAEGPRFGETIQRQGLDRWLFVDGRDPSNPIELADFTGGDSGTDVSVTIRGKSYPDIEGVTVGQNSSYQVELGETGSGTWNWFFGDTPTLFREFFAIKNDEFDRDFPVILSPDTARLVKPFPDSVSPGGSATAVLEYQIPYKTYSDETDTATLRVRRKVIDYANRSLFTIRYEFDEPDLEDGSVSDSFFYQYCDYDVGGDRSDGTGEPEYQDDVAVFETDPKPFVYTKEGEVEDSGDPIYIGFAGSALFQLYSDPREHHVGEWSGARTAVRNDDLNEEDEFPIEGSGDPATVLKWEFDPDYEDTTAIEVHFGAARSRDDLVSLITRPELSLSNVRLVQVVEDTRIERSDNYREPDPDLVRERNTTVLFDIGGQKVGMLPEDDSVTVEIERVYVVPPTLPGDPSPVTKTDTIELSGRQIQEVEEGNIDIREIFFEDESPPVFELTDGSRVLKKVQVSLAPNDPELSGDSVTLNRLDGDFSVAEMPPLRVGFIDVRDPDGGENYGDPDTGETMKYKATIRKAAELLSKYYPVTDLRIYRHDTPIRGATDDQGDVIQGGKALEIDAREAQCALENQLPVAKSDTISDYSGDIDEFDATVLIVPGAKSDFDAPGSYFDFHDEDVVGTEPVTKPRTAFVLDGKYEKGFSSYTPKDAGSVVTHEVGHHFKWKPYKGPTFDDKEDHPLAQRRKPEDEDSSDGEVVNFPHADPTTDNTPPTVTSVGYDLRDGRFSPAYESRFGDPEITRYDSFMSYSGDTQKWADSRIYQDLIDGEFNPQPPEREGERQSALMCSFLLNDDGSASDLGCTRCVTRPMVFIPDGSVLLSVRDSDGEEVASRRTNAGGGFIQEPSEYGSGPTVQENLVPAAIPFPDDAVAVEVTYEGTTTRIDPVSGLLRTAITTLPAAAFVRNPQQRQQALLNKLDAVERQMKDEAFRGAAQKLRNDIRGAIERWIAEAYPTETNVKTKAELLDLVDDLIDRISSDFTGPADDENGNDGDNSEGSSGQKRGNGNDGNGNEGNSGQKRGNGNDGDDDEGNNGQNRGNSNDGADGEGNSGQNRGNGNEGNSGQNRGNGK